jgi:hypothetical protein
MTHLARSFAVCLTSLLLGASGASAQSGYYNLDSGRPTRVEDALPTPRGELEVQFLPLRAEWLSDGSQRQRFEPKLSYGIFPMTEIEARLPIVHTQSRNSVANLGIASAAIGALHAFNVETRWPALAIAGEGVFPVGSLSASTPSYSAKLLMSKTLSFGRVELNAGGGTWAIRVPPPGPVFTPNQCGDPGQPVCIPPDVACDVTAVTRGPATSLACAPSAALPSAALTTRRTTGPHWTAALGVDHTLPLISTLVAAAVTVDRFEGLYGLNDWTAEVGVRHQLSPQILADVGLGRRFAGTTRATSITLGVAYSAPLRFWW